MPYVPAKDPGKHSSGHGAERMATVGGRYSTNVLESKWLSPCLLSWNLDDLLRELGHKQCQCHLPSSHDGLWHWAEQSHHSPLRLTSRLHSLLRLPQPLVCAEGPCHWVTCSDWGLVLPGLTSAFHPRVTLLTQVAVQATVRSHDPSTSWPGPCTDAWLNSGEVQAEGFSSGPRARVKAKSPPTPIPGLQAPHLTSPAVSVSLRCGPPTLP